MTENDRRSVLREIKRILSVSNEDAKRIEVSFAREAKASKRNYLSTAYDCIGELKTRSEDEVSNPLDGFVRDRAFRDVEKKRKLDNARIINPPKLKKGMKCKKCGSTNTWFYQLQTRSGDEPMTTFVRCEEVKCQARETIRG